MENEKEHTVSAGTQPWLYSANSYVLFMLVVCFATLLSLYFSFAYTGRTALHSPDASDYIYYILIAVPVLAFLGLMGAGFVHAFYEERDKARRFFVAGWKVLAMLVFFGAGGTFLMMARVGC